mgnify:CR=1 FL=1
MGRARGGLMGVHGHPPLCMLRYEDASAEKWLRWPAPCQTELVQERVWLVVPATPPVRVPARRLSLVHRPNETMQHP